MNAPRAIAAQTIEIPQPTMWSENLTQNAFDQSGVAITKKNPRIPLRHWARVLRHTLVKVPQGIRVGGRTSQPVPVPNDHDAAGKSSSETSKDLPVPALSCRSLGGVARSTNPVSSQPHGDGPDDGIASPGVV